MRKLSKKARADSLHAGDTLIEESGASKTGWHISELRQETYHAPVQLVLDSPDYKKRKKRTKEIPYKNTVEVIRG
jgi:hypothetical protein